MRANAFQTTDRNIPFLELNNGLNILDLLVGYRDSSFGRGGLQRPGMQIVSFRKWNLQLDHRIGLAADHASETLICGIDKAKID